VAASDDDRERWIESTAADLRAVLEDPAVRAELSALLVGDPQDVKRRRRLGELRDELSGYELRWGQREGDSDG
jgi:hypothetical protein